MYFMEIYRNPFARKQKGEGLATYLAAIELARVRGQRFGSSRESLTEDAMKIWRILVAVGIAHQIGDAKQIDTDPFGAKIFQADFEVIPSPK